MSTIALQHLKRTAVRHTCKNLQMCQFTTAEQNFMKLALRHAQHAHREKEVPIGAVIVDEFGKVIATARNSVEGDMDATSHAEINCLKRAAKVKNNWRLLNCTMYSTLEPCPMCLSAIQAFRIKRLVYGAKDHRLGACGSWLDLEKHNHPYHSVEIDGGLLADESANLLKLFFRGLRSNGKDLPDRGSVDI